MQSGLMLNTAEAESLSENLLSVNIDDDDSILQPVFHLDMTEDAEICISLDADGCYFNRTYVDKRKQALIQKGCSVTSFYGSYFVVKDKECVKPAAVLNDDEEFNFIKEGNPHLIDFLNQIKVTSVLCGSNRQSHEFDIRLAEQNLTTRYLLSLPKFVSFISNEFNREIFLYKFLLSDIENNLKPGVHFDSSDSKDIFPLDNDKFFLLYSQMHHVAVHRPFKPVKFYFIDDRYEILTRLKDFFKKNTDLIPKGVTLNLFCYTGKSAPAACFGSIVGTGLVDYNYSNNILELCSIINKERIANIREDQEFRQVYDEICTEFYTRGESVLTHAFYSDESKSLSEFKLHLSSHRELPRSEELLSEIAGQVNSASAPEEKSEKPLPSAKILGASMSNVIGGRRVSTSALTNSLTVENGPDPDMVRFHY